MGRFIEWDHPRELVAHEKRMYFCSPAVNKRIPFAWVTSPALFSLPLIEVLISPAETVQVTAGFLFYVVSAREAFGPEFLPNEIGQITIMVNISTLLYSSGIVLKF